MVHLIFKIQGTTVIVYNTTNHWCFYDNTGDQGFFIKNPQLAESVSFNYALYGWVVGRKLKLVDIELLSGRG